MVKLPPETLPPIDPHPNPQHRKGFMKKLFEHHHHGDQQDSSSKDKEGQQDEGKSESYEDYLKKDEHKLKDYYQKEERLEEEGDTREGLM